MLDENVYVYLAAIPHFMKVTLQILILSIFIFILSCNKLENKKTLLLASQKFNDLNKIDREFKIYSDSTFQFIETIKEDNHEKVEQWNGQVKIERDTVKFFPFKLYYNQSETAVLKNGFIEFIDGENPDRMKVEKTSLEMSKKIDFSRLIDIAVFTFYKNSHNQEFEKNLTNYDLNTKELNKINTIFETEFKKNNKLKDYKEYLKQFVAVKNNNNEILIQAHFFCKEAYLKEIFEYYEISMKDGRNCNVYLEYNLTKEKINFINIAGLA